MEKTINTLKVSIFFGGPSSERNISLDSARTFFDSLYTRIPSKNIFLIFFSKKLEPFLLHQRWIYSNTIEDFEDLLDKPIVGKKLSKQQLESFIKKSDVLMPLIHGTFGEDGQLIKLFTAQKNLAWVGSAPEVLQLSLDKHLTQTKLQQLGFITAQSMLFPTMKENAKTISQKACSALRIKKDEVVFVKPNDGGSSDGVSRVSIEDLEKAINHARLFSEKVLIEKKIEGKEFSLIVLQDDDEKIIPLFPSAIEIASKQGEEHLSFYTRKKKYMPGSGAHHRTPANFAKPKIEEIRKQGKLIFEALNFQHWARFDGFLSDDNKIVWSELNGIPGMGIDSFLFQQCALAGVDVQAVSFMLLSNALKKENHRLAPVKDKHHRQIKKIAVIGGGESSERQVSRMSWHNVCVKLSSMPSYQVHPIYMDQKKKLWRVPSSLTLLHTVEEIDDALKKRKNYDKLLKNTLLALKDFVLPSGIEKEKVLPIQTTSLEKIKKCDYCFLALHGGIGENGVLQKKLEALKINYNGSDSTISSLCSDKQKLNKHVADLKLKHVKTLDNFSFTLDALKKWLKKHRVQIPDIDKNNFSAHDPRLQSFEKGIFHFLNEQFERFKISFEEFVIKPAQDGCSTGVLVLKSDLKREGKLKMVALYLNAILKNFDHLPMHHLDHRCKDEEQMMLLPSHKKGLLKLMVEKLIDTSKKNFLELTITVLGKRGRMQSLLPSETISQTSALSLEEKFNKGVGPNLTPPRRLQKSEVHLIQTNAALLANRLGLSDYARIDFFYDCKKKLLYLIEVNTLPGLTTATVLFTQALATKKVSAKPTQLLSKIIEMS